MDDNLLPKISFLPFSVPSWCWEDVVQCLCENSTLLSKYGIEPEAFDFPVSDWPFIHPKFRALSLNKLNCWHCILPKSKEVYIF